MSKNSVVCINNSCLLLLRLLILIATYAFFVAFIFFWGKDTRVEEAMLFNRRVEVNINSFKTYDKNANSNVEKNTSHDIASGGVSSSDTSFEEYITTEEKPDATNALLNNGDLQNVSKPDVINIAELSDKPTIFFIVTGLGSNKPVTELAMNLPDFITLGFSLYGDNKQSWIENSQQDGHDFIINIPMQTSDNNNNEQYTLSTKLSLDQNIDQLNKITNKSDNYVAAYSGYDEVFTSDLLYTKTLVSALRQQNKYFIYANKNINPAILQIADEMQYPIIVPDIYLNDPILDQDIALKFNQFEEIATKNGFAVVMLQSYPNVLQFLIKWLSDNHDKNFNVAPVSLILGKEIINVKKELVN